MTDKEFIKELVTRGHNADKGYFEFAHIVACYLDKRLHDQLNQLVNGPVYDGDVVSKSDRSELFNLGLAIRVCIKGEQGYTGATYFAFSVNKRIQEIRTGKVGA
jgi:hypothetical protein